MAAVAAVAAGVGSVGAIAAASVEARMAETWRAVGLVFFGGLFALLAWRPRAHRGLWEITIASKVVLAVLASVYAVLGEASGAGQSAAADGMLAVLVGIAYLVLEAWRPWGESGARGAEHPGQ